jgi:hypothetical protein
MLDTASAPWLGAGERGGVVVTRPKQWVSSPYRKGDMPRRGFDSLPSSPLSAGKPATVFLPATCIAWPVVAKSTVRAFRFQPGASQRAATFAGLA